MDIPLDEVIEIIRDRDDAMIVRSIIDLGRNLGVKVPIPGQAPAAD